jgi:hypothetical protein
MKMKMKMTESWGWLAVGVLAAGLNASYHNGGLQWAHEIADRVEHDSAAVFSLASGNADQFLAEARMLTTRDETASCQFSNTVSRVQSSIVHAEAGVDRFAAMSERQEAQLERVQARRDRIEARIVAKIAAQTAHLRPASAAFAPAPFDSLPAPVVCPRVRVNIPRVPMIKIPALPVVHVETASAGPV